MKSFRLSGTTGLPQFALLILILLLAYVIFFSPSRGSPTQARRVRCAVNLKTQATALHAYAADNSNHWPASAGTLNSLCDQSLAFRDALIACMPSTNNSKTFYCPANSQNPSSSWSHGGISTWGYLWLNQRTTSSPAIPATLPPTTPPLAYHFDSSKPHPAATDIAFDVIVSDSDSNPINFTPATPPISSGTNHLIRANTPNGSNILALDGHVEWRKFNPTDRRLKLADQFLWFPKP